MVSDSLSQAPTVPSMTLNVSRDKEENKPTSPLSGIQHTKSLPAVLNTKDLTALMLLIVLFIANTNGVQFGGPVAFIYWTLGLITFLVPCALVTQWLAKRFPGQGGPYLWAIHILGPGWGFITAFCAWLPGVLAVVSAIESGLMFIQYLAPTWFTTPAQQGLAIVFILLVPTGMACLPLRWLKHILFVVAALYFGVFILLGLAGSWWLLSGHPAALALNVANAWRPTNGNFAVYGLVILALLGVNIPIFMGDEIRGGHAGAKKATAYVWWGTVLAFLAYVAGTFGIMVIVPANQAGALAANVQAISIVFGTPIGNMVDIVLAVSQVVLTIAYILMFSRLLVVVAQNGRLPVSLARVNRFGVPVVSIFVQAAAVALVTILSLVVVPNFFGTLIRPDDLALAIYNVLQAGTTVVWVCSIIQIFVLVMRFLHRHKEQGESTKRERILLRTLSVIGIGTSLIGIWATISSSWLPSTIPNGKWVVLVLGVTFIALAVGGVSSELPHVYALLSEQRQLNAREVVLRAQLQESYDEQQILVQQQQVLLAEVDRLYQEQSQAALTDAITSLPNHRAVMRRIDEEVSRCHRTDRTCAVLFIDLDHFKSINDTWGHQAGDTILREVGHRLRTNIRQEDFVGRYGGEEFAVVLTGSDLDAAYQAAERLRVAIAIQPCPWKAEDAETAVDIEVTASIGVAIYILHGTQRDEMIQAADAAMYQAKHSGRNCVRIANIEKASVSNIVAADRDKQGLETTAVKALTAAAQAHDHGTDAHARRMVHYADAIARELGCSQQDIHLLRLATLLHDIGKIGIPDAILHKPGPLTTEEWELMRNHPEISRQILVQAGGIFERLGNIVLAHHERWDGRGYPNGLEQDAIPMIARIISVLDSYDAMTSRRVYHEPISVTEARAELQRCAGSQFDPRVVEAFLRVLDRDENDTPYIGVDQELARA